MTNHPFSIVLDYVNNDALPAELRALGLEYRSAILLPATAEGIDADFDDRLYLSLLDAAFEATSATEAAVLMDNGETRSAGDAAELKSTFTSLPESDEPLPEVCFLASAESTGLLISEPYARVGGPSPFHDTYTVSLFADEERCRRFAAALEVAAGAKPEQVIQGSAGPNDSKWARFTNRVLSVLGVRPAGEPKSVLARSWGKSRTVH